MTKYVYTVGRYLRLCPYVQAVDTSVCYESLTIGVCYNLREVVKYIKPRNACKEFIMSS